MENSPLIFGFILQSSMIMALGAQNLFVIEKGLLKDRPLLVASICSFCDVSLIFMGVLGAGAFFAQNPMLSMILKLAGSAFLLKYAYGKFREAGTTKVVEQVGTQASALKAIILSTLAVSLLNPHVYLDTVVLIGGYSTKYQSVQEKLNFAIGAAILSILWFFTLSSAASFFSKALTQPKVMKYVNYGTSGVMTYLGVNLLLSI
ncbi:MAG: LysE family transporter [Bdellovibrionota bacterium]